MKKMLTTVPTSTLLFVASACLSRLSNRGLNIVVVWDSVNDSEFERLLISQEDEMADEARKLWNYTRNNFSTHDLCNKCGNFLNRNENWLVFDSNLKCLLVVIQLSVRRIRHCNICSNWWLFSNFRPRRNFFGGYSVYKARIEKRKRYTS